VRKDACEATAIVEIKAVPHLHILVLLGLFLIS